MYNLSTFCQCTVENVAGRSWPIVELISLRQRQAFAKGKSDTMPGERTACNLTVETRSWQENDREKVRGFCQLSPTAG